MKKLPTLIFVVLCLVLHGCATTQGTTPAEKRQSVLEMKNKALTDLYKVRPDARSKIKQAPGYAVFSSANVNVIFAAFGGGYGVAKNNKTGQYTYMRMGEVGVGVGMGVKDVRLVFVFNSTKAMNDFVEKGWAFGAQADAAAKASDKGDAAGAEIAVNDMTIYQVTESGLALQATIKGTKYWKDETLN